ncbi:MAG: glycosyltransferase [Planctomycetota bacterium]
MPEETGGRLVTPPLSVLLPVKNAEATLPSCLRSLLRQTFSRFEIVAVDDGSDDASRRVLDSYARRDDRLRVVDGPAKGIVAALETGFSACRAPIIARMDADDVALRRRFELQWRHLAEHSDIDLVSCLVTSVPARDVREGYRIYEEWLNALVHHEDIAREIFIESPIAHPTVMMRRGALERAGGYRDAGWAEDYDLWLRMWRSGARFAKVPHLLHLWRDHPSRHSRTDARYSVENFLRCKAHHLARGPLSEQLPLVIWGAGMKGRRLAKHLIREGLSIRAFIDIDPLKIGRELRGAPVCSPDSLPGFRGHPILAAVGSRGARAEIRARLEAAGFFETGDFLCVA